MKKNARFLGNTCGRVEKLMAKHNERLFVCDPEGTTTPPAEGSLDKMDEAQKAIIQDLIQKTIAETAEKTKADLASEMDRRVNKFVEENKSLKDEVGTLNQKLTDKDLTHLSEDQKKQAETERRIETLEAEKIRSEGEAKTQRLTNLAITSFTEHSLPVKLVRFFVGNTEDETKSNIESLKAEFETSVLAEIAKRLKNEGRDIPTGVQNISGEQNPFSKATLNYTAQAVLRKTNPELAKKLEASAG